MGASILAATHSRYVIDLNRPPDNANLYPGRDTTGLCPVDTFDKTPVYAGTGAGPDDAEIAARRDAVWHPYHAALAGELARLRAEHGTVALWEAHSIRSVLPRFFEGRLPDFNWQRQRRRLRQGPADRLLAIAQAVPGHTAVLNGRYKGGHHALLRPAAAGVHAVQLELAQCAYMSEQYPFAYDAPRATALQPVLRDMLGTMLAFVEGK